MKKLTILKQLKAVGVIAVVRGATKAEAIQASDALVAGGVTGLEITFRAPLKTYEKRYNRLKIS